MIFDLQSLADYMSLPVTGLLVVILSVGVLLFIIYKDLSHNKGGQRLLLLSVFVGSVLLLGVSGAFPGSGGNVYVPGRPVVDYKWQEVYVSKAESALDDYDNFVANTDYYDYDNQVVANAAYLIAGQSKDPYEAVQKTASYVYQEVGYLAGESDVSCFEGTAPQIISSGSGQCDTQSIAVIAILRKMGVAAAPVGGCIVRNPSCYAQSFLQSVGLIGATPQFTQVELSDEDVVYARKGGLHAWVVAWIPDKGWVSIEATTGKVADTSCYYYHVELFPENHEKDDICVSKNYQYAKACSQNDLVGLNAEGLGLVTEVSP